MNPLVSVVIPTYNRPGPLCELIECLFRQTHKNIEIIIVNDNGEKVDFIKELYPELKILILDMSSNVKHVTARNAGVSAASGTYIMLCDDDDLVVPTHITTMLSEISEFEMVYSDVEIVEFITEGRTRIPAKRSLFAYEYDLEAMRSFSTFIPSGCLYLRDIHTKIGMFDENVYHYWDWDFFLRVSDKFRIKRVPVAGTLYAFASGGDNLSEGLSSMEPYLNQLSKKHDLGKLPTRNFFLLLEEPKVKERRSESNIIWDGQPVVSRWSLVEEGGTGL
ncbi:putative glycosyltransferase YwdF [Paenibacillus baekrokdamisoli]|uniref:Putative glycosyltransferase YwdF n=1 Tax=Paenibacillus baekrokdamisoli TaxID=1712516 RepID=A0A3G9IPG6_9BACL|nr:glycosyltransferase family 2 protein [Paenibacillus baekrokdamisoli]MBB3072772.1 glycosyltransferase involved in cell wall biosynthesis [Paenibacillus baekrokdamisoli]BBH20162.1 putative glycosyltransferase YwdF [Paenibacillus baekrokdamisoli]